MVSAARLGQLPNRGQGRIRAVQGGLVTSKNRPNRNLGSNLGANLKSRLSGGNVGKVGGNTGKGQFVLANKFGNQGRVLIRTGKLATGQQQKGLNRNVKGVVAANSQRSQQQQKIQPRQAFGQVKTGRQVQQNQGNRAGNQNGQQQKSMQQQQQQPIQQQQQQQRQPRYNPPQQNNETKLALDIINILLEDKKKDRQPQQAQPRRQRRPMNWAREEELYQPGPKTVYIQQPAPRPIYVQQAPKTVYVDENGYDAPPPRRMMQQQQPVLVRRQAVRQAPPVQVLRQSAGPRMMQRSTVQRRLY